MPKGSPRVDRSLVVAYVRVSTDLERQELGAEGQRVAIEKGAASSGRTIVAWHVEEVSGGAPLDKRPVLLQALASLAVHHAGTFVVQRLDRFSRDPMTAALAETELRRHGAVLACADGAGSGDDPTAELVRGILLNVARFEKAMIRARIKAALAVKKTRGELTGAPPYGWRVGSDGKTLERDPHEQGIRERLASLRAAGLTMRETVAACRVRSGHSRSDRQAAHAFVRSRPGPGRRPGRARRGRVGRAASAGAARPRGTARSFLTPPDARD